ncbi:hypothetical protein [Chromobacterium subtsugae]|uniref:hypothetical protein n=1 Tax=Chromobacterium subtsugae TaxID=251747 RepID=UPI00064175B1|nr:hypothetical protein [Chromobacterium subtsugae]
MKKGQALGLALFVLWLSDMMIEFFRVEDRIAGIPPLPSPASLASAGWNLKGVGMRNHVVAAGLAIAIALAILYLVIVGLAYLQPYLFQVKPLHMVIFSTAVVAASSLLVIRRRLRKRG